MNKQFSMKHELNFLYILDYFMATEFCTIFATGACVIHNQNFFQHGAFLMAVKKLR
jgi:hypothetical protein